MNSTRILLIKSTFLLVLTLSMGAAYATPSPPPQQGFHINDSASDIVVLNDDCLNPIQSDYRVTVTAVSATEASEPADYLAVKTRLYMRVYRSPDPGDRDFDESSGPISSISVEYSKEEDCYIMNRPRDLYVKGWHKGRKGSNRPLIDETHVQFSRLMR